MVYKLLSFIKYYFRNTDVFCSKIFESDSESYDTLFSIHIHQTHKESSKMCCNTNQINNYHLCICVFILYTHIHTYIHTYIHTHIIHTYIHTYTHIHTYIHTHTHTYINTHTYIHTYIIHTFMDQTVDHIIYRCVLHEQERNRLKSDINSSEKWPVSKNILATKYYKHFKFFTDSIVFNKE